MSAGNVMPVVYVPVEEYVSYEYAIGSCTEEVHPVTADINRVYQCKSLVLPLCDAHASFLIAVYYHTVAQFLIA